jgi:hypothetical protein
MPPRGDSTFAARITAPFAKRGENLSRTWPMPGNGQPQVRELHNMLMLSGLGLRPRPDQRLPLIARSPMCAA